MDETENDTRPEAQWYVDKTKVWRVYRWGAVVLMLGRWVAFGGKAEDLLSFFVIASLLFFAFSLSYLLRPPRLTLSPPDIDIDGLGPVPLPHIIYKEMEHHAVLKAHALLIDTHDRPLGRKQNPRGAKAVFRDAENDCLLALFYAPRLYCNRSASAFFAQVASASPEPDKDFAARAEAAVRRYLERRSG